MPETTEKSTPEDLTPVTLGVVRRRTADHGDPARSWTVQSGEPFPDTDEASSFRFDPAELPDPEAARASGLIPQIVPPLLIAEGKEHETLSPTANPPLDHPARDHFRAEVPDLYSDVDNAYDVASAQRDGSSAGALSPAQADAAAAPAVNETPVTDPAVDEPAGDAPPAV